MFQSFVVKVVQNKIKCFKVSLLKLLKIQKMFQNFVVKAVKEEKKFSKFCC
jgi:hypothetical protein